MKHDDSTVSTEETKPSGQDPSNTDVEQLLIPLPTGDDIHDRVTALYPFDDTDVRP